MRLLIIGSGGREHALAWKLAQSPMVEEVLIAPGNGGTLSVGRNCPVAADDITALVELAQREKIDLVVPGPELPLTLGITDAMSDAGIKCFGPDQYGARLEGSKSFAKEVMLKAGVPTARSAVFTDLTAAREHVENGPEQCVIKADGLAAGKGVIVADNKAQALEALNDMLGQRSFGNAGARVVIEERLAGEEVSLLCLCDGLVARPLPSAQDHKAVYDGDKGPNTGGMGAYSPAPILPDDQLERMADMTIRPILRAMAEAGHPFRGILYAGLMITASGPKVLEYNVRFGDPECEPLMMRMDSDLAAHMLACCENRLAEETITFKPQSAVGVVLAAAGYPGSYDKGMAINGLEDAGMDAKVFHSGTVADDGGVKSAGGRVLCVTSLGDSLRDATDKAYAALGKITMPNGQYRTDIASKGIARCERGE